MVQPPESIAARFPRRLQPVPSSRRTNMANDRRKEEGDWLRDAIAKLRPLERQVLLLSAGERLRSDEIAARLGITPKKARRLLARALCKVDRALERRERPWWRFW